MSTAVEVLAAVPLGGSCLRLPFVSLLTVSARNVELYTPNANHLRQEYD
jgi:hypothetical protein